MSETMKPPEKEILKPGEADFRDLLIESTLMRPDRAVPPEVNTIIWDNKFATWATEMLKYSLEHNQEVARPLKTGLEEDTFRPRLLVQTQMTYGEESSVTAPTGLNAPNRLREKLVTVLHTHSRVDVPPSTSDCYPLLLDPKDPDAQTCAAVITHGRKILVFRQPGAITMTAPQAEETIAEWKAKVFSGGSFTDIVAGLFRHHREEGFLVSTTRRQQARELLQRAQEYNWAIFIAPRGSRRFERTTNLVDFTRITQAENKNLLKK